MLILGIIAGASWIVTGYVLLLCGAAKTRWYVEGYEAGYLHGKKDKQLDQEDDLK